MNKLSRNFWRFPWKLKQAFVIALSFPLIGLLLDLVTSRDLVWIPQFPYNLITFLLFIALIGLISFRYKKSKLVQFLSGIPASISAITVFIGVLLLMGLIPQHPDSTPFAIQLRLNDILNSGIFLFSLIYLLIILTFTIFTRVYPFRWRNVGFLLNHLGLLIILGGATMGSSDLYRLKMLCAYDTPVWYGTDQRGKQYKLPFAIELKKFHIDYYDPELVLIDRETQEAVKIKVKPDAYVKRGKKVNFNDEVKVTIDTFHRHAFESKKIFLPAERPGNTQAVKVRVYDAATKKTWKGWISAGSFIQYPHRIKLQHYDLGLAPPKPKKYSSEFKLYEPGKEPETITLVVNKPVRSMGWKLYQVSYDIRKGKWSEYTIIEAVKDPWLPLVYIGFYMLLAGALLLIWQGANLNRNG